VRLRTVSTHPHWHPLRHVSCTYFQVLGSPRKPVKLLKVLNKRELALHLPPHSIEVSVSHRHLNIGPSEQTLHNVRITLGFEEECAQAVAQIGEPERASIHRC
jgi:hypothetical protein